MIKIKLSHIIPISLVAGFAIFMMVYFPDYTKLRKMRMENEKLVIKMQELEKEIKVLERQMETIDKDKSAYEKYARDELGVAKSDEIVIDIQN